MTGNNGGIQLERSDRDWRRGSLNPVANISSSSSCICFVRACPTAFASMLMQLNIGVSV